MSLVAGHFGAARALQHLRATLHETSVDMRIGAVAAACASLLTVLACGGSTTSPQSGPAVASSAAITQYQDLTASVQSAAVSYGTSMAGPGMTLGGCAAAHDAYDAQVRPWLSQMGQMSASMDAF